MSVYLVEWTCDNHRGKERLEADSVWHAARRVRFRIAEKFGSSSQRVAITSVSVEVDPPKVKQS